MSSDQEEKKLSVNGYWLLVNREEILPSVILRALRGQKFKRTNGARPYQPSPTGWVSSDPGREEVMSDSLLVNREEFFHLCSSV